MPIVVLTLRSPRGKSVPDHVRSVELRGRLFGPVQPADIDVRPNGEIVLDVAPDTYTVDVDVDGFRPTRGTLGVGSTSAARVLELLSPLKVLPKVGELTEEPRRLLQTLDPLKTPGAVWDALEDNKMATFFQVSHALSAVSLSDGSPLSSLVEGVVRVGSSQLRAADVSGTMQTVIGWRMHVALSGGRAMEELLQDAGFKKDGGTVHPTHKRFGFVNSFREKGANPRLQIVMDREGARADVDLDNGAFHRSSPKEIYKAFAKRFPDGSAVYKVDTR